MYGSRETVLVIIIIIIIIRKQKFLTCKNQLLPADHHHSSNTQIYQRWNHFHINHTADNWSYSPISVIAYTSSKKVWGKKFLKKRIFTLGLKYSWTWKVETGPESILMSHSWNSKMRISVRNQKVLADKT